MPPCLLTHLCAALPLVAWLSTGVSLTHLCVLGVVNMAALSSGGATLRVVEVKLQSFVPQQRINNASQWRKPNRNYRLARYCVFVLLCLLLDVVLADVSFLLSTFFFLTSRRTCRTTHGTSISMRTNFVEGLEKLVIHKARDSSVDNYNRFYRWTLS